MIKALTRVSGFSLGLKKINTHELLAILIKKQTLKVLYALEELASTYLRKLYLESKRKRNKKIFFFKNKKEKERIFHWFSMHTAQNLFTGGRLVHFADLWNA